MTSFSRRFVGKSAAVAAVALVMAGCGPKDGLKELAKGREAFDDRNLAKAVKFFEKSLELAPDNVDTLVYFAKAKLELGELAAADEAVTRAGALAAEDLDVRILSAQLAWHLEDYGRAKALYKAIAEDEKLEAVDRSRGWTGLGIVEMSENNPQLARVAFLRAIRLDRRSPSAWYHLALLYRDSLGYLEAALEQFEIFVRLDEMASPRVQKVQRNLIPELKERLATVAAGRPGASQRDSAASASAISKAESAWAKKQYKTAQKFYQEALASDPLSYPAALGLGKAFQKTDTSKAGQAKAFEKYKLACSLRAGAISTFLTAGSMATKLGYHSQAVEIYSRAVAAAPTSIPALDGFIAALRRVGGKTSVARAYQDYRDSLKTKKK